MVRETSDGRGEQRLGLDELLLFAQNLGEPGIARRLLGEVLQHPLPAPFGFRPVSTLAGKAGMLDPDTQLIRKFLDGPGDQ